MPKRKRQVDVEPFVFQQSLLLQLPAELRNNIYEECVVDESLSIRSGQILYSSPLSLVCRQIRQEYRQIYFDEAPYFAKVVNVFAPNFIAHGLEECLSGLPLPNPLSERQFLIHVILDNFWSREDLRHFLAHTAVKSNKEFLRLRKGNCETYWPSDIRAAVSYTISFDPRTFDVHLCRQLLPRIAWCHGTGDRVDTHWLMIEAALTKELDKHDQKSVKKRRKKRKESSARKIIESKRSKKAETARTS